MNCSEPVTYLHAENPDREESYEEFDFFLFTKLTDARSLILKILQDRILPVTLRIAVVLSLSHDLQERIDKNALYDADTVLERYSSENVREWFEARLRKLNLTDRWEERRRRTLLNLFSILDQLEALRDDWKPYLHNTRRILENAPVPTVETELQFHKLFSDVIAEQLLVYFVFSYFCGAVYNGNAYGKMKFSIAGMILIRELLRTQWLAGQSTDTKCITRTACRYAREVEHSDYNKTTMEHLLGREDVFGIEDLFSIL